MSLLETAVGWLAPPTCVGCGAEGSALCTACNSSEILPFGERCWNCGVLSPRSKTCLACRQKNYPNYVWVCTNYDGLAKKLVQKLKFNHQRAAAEPISGLMIETMLQQNDDMQLAAKRYLIIPVPTAASRVRQRGFDQTELLAKAIAARLGIKKSSALRRLGSAKQVGSSRQTRQAQVKNSYLLKKGQAVSGRNILIIDDVVTTGATLAEMATVLRRSGARSVDALVFAKRL